MGEQLNKTRIQNRLISLARDWDFPTIKYHRNTFEVIETAVTAHPHSVLANETESSFGLPERQRRTRAREKFSWIFKLYVSFTQEVSIESFEDYLAAHPTLLARDATNGLNQVELLITSTEVQHPVTGESAVGTSAVFTFEANLAPT